MDFKKEVVDLISDQIDLPQAKINELIERPKNAKMGDYAFPCFALAKVLHQNPAAIAFQTLGTQEENIAELPWALIEHQYVRLRYQNFTCCNQTTYLTSKHQPKMRKRTRSKMHPRAPSYHSSLSLVEKKIEKKREERSKERKTTWMANTKVIEIGSALKFP